MEQEERGSICAWVELRRVTLIGAIVGFQTAMNNVMWQGHGLFHSNLRYP
jgi:hypothetical protein